MFDVVNVLKDAKSIGITGHIRPDGDCVGSTMAMYMYLTKSFPKKRIDIFLEPIPEAYSLIKRLDEVRTDFVTDVDKYDAFVVIDCDNSRIGQAQSFFENATLKINIDHQLQRTNEMQYIIQETKTNAGTRILPMDNEVYACFKRIIANRKAPKIEPMIEGYSGFLYLDKNYMPMVALHWEKYFQHICEKYNNIYRVQMPKVTPHVCRHTYCSHMASSGFNPKHLQYLMGHSDIGVTLNTYTHVDFDNVEKEVKELKKAVL